MADSTAATGNQVAGSPEEPTSTAADSTPATGSQKSGHPEEAPVTQRCSRCKKHKPLSDFRIVRGGSLGKVCIPCRVDHRRASTIPPAPLASGIPASTDSTSLPEASAAPGTQAPEQTSSSAETGGGGDAEGQEGGAKGGREVQETEDGVAVETDELGSAQRQEHIVQATGGRSMTQSRARDLRLLREKKEREKHKSE